MDRKEVIDNPVTVAGITLIPIATASSSYWCRKHGLAYFGIKQPLSIAVITRSEKKAFRMTGEEIPFDRLIREVPDIQETLAQV